MRFHIGPVPKSDENLPGVWTPLRDLGPYTMLLFGVPIGGVAFVIVGWLWLYETPALKNIGNNPNTLLVELIVAMFAIFPIHEFLHMIFHPQFGLSRKTVLGVWPSRLLCYAYYDGVISRNRFIVIFAMPLLVITILPLFIAFTSGHASILVAFVSSLNALGAGLDIFAIILLFWLVPQNANVCNRGGRTLWNQPES
jgi:hypothetical protein